MLKLNKVTFNEGQVVLEDMGQSDPLIFRLQRESNGIETVFELRKDMFFPDDFDTTNVVHVFGVVNSNTNYTSYFVFMN